MLRTRFLLGHRLEQLFSGEETFVKGNFIFKLFELVLPLSIIVHYMLYWLSYKLGCVVD